jgi:phage terminase Nu1 subunit (DNA packaging protein)
MSHHHHHRLSQVKIAKHFEVHPRTVANWVGKGCPQTSVKAITKWRRENMRSERQPSSKRGDGPATLTEERLKADTLKILADVDLRELRLAEKRGELVSLSETAHELAEMVIRIKERLLAAPDEFQTRFPEPVRLQCKAEFDAFIRGLLLEISRWDSLLDPDIADAMIVAEAARIIAERSKAATTAAHDKA